MDSDSDSGGEKLGIEALIGQDIQDDEDEADFQPSDEDPDSSDFESDASVGDNRNSGEDDEEKDESDEDDELPPERKRRKRE